MDNRNTYRNRMDMAIRNKNTIIDMIRQETPNPKSILDFGCGTGKLSFNLSNEFPNTIITGFDKADDMIAHARKENQNKNIIYTNKLDQRYDVIVFSSVFHEIYSYGNEDESVFNCIKNLPLKSNGFIVIRDCLKQSSDEITIKPVSAHHAAQFLAALKEYTKKYKNYYDDIIIKDDTMTGPKYQLAEFLNKYTWGQQSLLRESQEITGFYTKSDWENVLTPYFSNIAITADCDYEYFSYLNKKVYIPELWDTHIYIKAKK